MRILAFFATLLAVPLSFGEGLREEIRCQATTLEQLNLFDQEPGPIEVKRSELFAVRQMVKNGDKEQYMTEGKYTYEDGSSYTYSSERLTKRVDLSETLYKEISSVKTKTFYPGMDTKEIEYQLEVTYEVQQDGTNKVVETLKDGEKVSENGVEFKLKGLDGAEYSSYFEDQPVEYPFEGGVYKTLSSKMICVTTRQ